MKSVWLVGVLVCFAGVANGQALGSRETPRGSLQTFLQFMSIAEGGDGRALLEAVDCLDLSELPAAQRDTLGPLYAGQLYSVLQQLEAKPGAAPTTREGEPYANEGVTLLAWADGRFTWISDFFKDTERF